MTEYKKTLNLPSTTFPMKANLAKNEPKMIDFWQNSQIYKKMIEANKGCQRFVLHDGPPYANGHIHLGTAMNKVLKDIVVKSKNLQGYQAEYVPGWDCHGLPIELKVEKELGKEKSSLSILDIRKRCREYALKYLDIQREEFKRLGVLGTWEQPYLTMDPAYESATARELARFMQRGSVVRHKKPIHWCSSCQTALAEAEVEYYERQSPSIYVRFPLTDPELTQKLAPATPQNTYVVIWTTTPWTIPDNMAIVVHPEFEYVLIENQGEYYILAKDLWEDCATRFSWDSPQIITQIKGQELENLQARHPFYDRAAPLILGEHVTLEAGTGCVHTAPGHGQEDYETGIKYGLDIYSPLDDRGRFLPEVDYFAGLNVFEANPKVIETLQEKSNLLAQEEISHSYPHCWRCKKPVIFRATTQWFISMEHNSLREKSLKAIEEDVNWIPSWGRQRIYNMIEHRPDWCISRQRMWGVPIIALICKGCHHAYFDPEWVNSIVDRFAQHERGADYWFEASLEEIIPPGLKCPQCGRSDWEKEDDILDVWFDSGTSFAAVVEQREECHFPADIYLEGSDQHRGWFHSSLLASIGTRDVPPYRSVLTHGFVVDGKGRKMSKSIGNVIAPQEIMSKYGAEILRMWVASENYQEDLRISENILKQLVDTYRRIRNTCRFILGNISDFDPGREALEIKDLLPLDRYALSLINKRHKAIQKAYSAFEYHKVFHTLHNICVTDLSAFYLDILKDRLYVYAPKSTKRLSAQTALWHILLTLIRDMAPILSFTAEEVYQHLPEAMQENVSSIFELQLVQTAEEILSTEEQELWSILTQVRSEVTKAIEPIRKSGHVGHSLDTHIILYCSSSLYAKLLPIAETLREIFIVSAVSVRNEAEAPAASYESDELEGLRIEVEHAPGEKCERCWTYSQQLNRTEPYPQACPRCLEVLQIIENES
jgi:isoleucyl-tRNA synthetase